MKLQNYQTKFVVNDFVLNAVNVAVSRSKHSEYRRHLSVQPHTSFRFFVTGAGDLYFLLVSPTSHHISKDYMKVMADHEEYAKYPRVLDLINYDVILTPDALSSVEGFTAVRQALRDDKISTYAQLNSILSKSCAPLFTCVNFSS